MLINLRNALMAGKRLPYDAEVEYLESTGTQWIDTGVTPDFSLSMSATLCKTDTSAGFLFGARKANATNSFCLASFSTYARFDFGGTGGGSGQTNVSPICDGNMHTISVAYPTITLDGESNTMESAASFSINRNIVLFANNTNGSITKYSGVRIAALKLYSNSVLVRDYIPVRKGTVGYLYDRVSGMLFGNAGTGDFVVGQDVVPVEWLEGTGTQYIDTGVGYFADFEIGIKLRTSIPNKALGIATNMCMERLNSSNPVWTLSTRDYGKKTSNAIITDYHVMSWRSGVFAADGNYVDNVTNSFSAGTMTLFGAGEYFFQNMIFFCNLYAQTGDQVRKFLPVRVGTGSTWDGAMMDVLTRRIYRNAGTGAFGYGNDLKYPIPA